MNVEGHGFVTVLQVRGGWQEKLRQLTGYYLLPSRSLDAISRFIAERPLEPKSEQNPDHREYYLGILEGGWMMFYTNHHWFPVVWIIKPFPPVLLNVKDGAVLNHDTLRTFYQNGRGHYQSEVSKAGDVGGEIFQGILPTDYHMIETSMPDKLLERFYPEYR